MDSPSRTGKLKQRLTRHAQDRIDRGLIRRFEPSVEQLLDEFSYREQPTMIHWELLRQMEVYYKENELFMTSLSRSHQIAARKALHQIWHLCRLRRREIKAQYTNRPRRGADQDIPEDIAHRENVDPRKVRRQLNGT